MDDDKYPHWKAALFGNHNAVANLRCAVHYVFWHTVYGLLAVLGVLVVGAIKTGKFIAQYLGPVEEPVVAFLDRLLRGVEYVITHRYTQKVFKGFVAICAIGLLVGGAVTIVYSLYTMFWTTVAIFGGIVLGFGALIGALLLAEFLSDPAKSAATGVAVRTRAIGERAVETPGVRRVYGECPVSMDMAPKWFDKLFPEEDL